MRGNKVRFNMDSKVPLPVAVLALVFGAVLLAAIGLIAVKLLPSPSDNAAEADRIVNTVDVPQTGQRTLVSRGTQPATE